MISGSQENISYLLRRVPFLMAFVIAFLFLVVARLYHLQVSQGDHYKKLADETFVREEEIIAPRGIITDRNGKPLADTRVYHEIVIVPQYLDNRDKILDSLTKILPIKKDEILAKLDEARYEPRFAPVVIVADAPFDWVVKLEEYMAPSYDAGHDISLHGVAVRSYPIRRYLYPEVFSHALGYLTEINKANLKKEELARPGVFSLGDLTGAAGVESAYDTELKGKDGVLARVVDARGREVTGNVDLAILKQRATLAAAPGFTLRTTLDFGAQMAAAKAFAELKKKGAVVALDPQTGEVLVMFSTPGFDANRLTKNVDKDYWTYINRHPDKILYNRVVQGQYPPASTYKIVGLTAGIDSGKIDPEKTKVTCTGGVFFGNRTFKCWGSHGTLTALYGLARSCDSYFYRVGLAVGIDTLAKYAHLYGFGALTGIEIPHEKPGLVPSTEWKQKRYKQRWYESETLSAVIGQSYDLVTPLQNAVAAAMVANGGYRVRPHMAVALTDSLGAVVKTYAPEVLATPLVGKVAMDWVKRGMIEVVHGSMGTAKRLAASPNKIAGKTGTAQVVGHGEKVAKGRNTENHGLFISFAPYDNPKIAVAVIVEHGRGGSATAAPTAMQVIDAFFAANHEN